jgi:ribosome-associated protein
MSGTAREVAVRDDAIRLGQLLKLADLVDTGGAARALLETGRVSVNGAPETRRGATLKRGDVVEVDGERITLV